MCTDQKVANTDKAEEHFFEVGRNYFIRTITHHYVGELLFLNRRGAELVLTQAAWIADDGRFHQMLRTGEFDEIEPYLEGQRVLVNRDAIIDAVEWTQPLPRSQK